MTDNEIIKALECCIGGYGVRNCDDCSMHGKVGCIEALPEFALDLINRQKAEIERLEKENAKQKAMLEAIDNEMLPLPFETDFDKAIKTAKSEAIKEFVHRLKDRVVQKYEYTDTRIFEEIDNLVKEMTEVEK